MENQGYEGERAKRRLVEDDGHVYEDIAENCKNEEISSAGIGNSKRTPQESSYPTNVNDRHTPEYLEPINGTLTLPLRREYSKPYSNFANSSVRVTSKERQLYETPLTVLPSNVQRLAPVRDEKSSRRRLKKDCRRCRVSGVKDRSESIDIYTIEASDRLSNPEATPVLPESRSSKISRNERVSSDWLEEPECRASMRVNSIYSQKIAPIFYTDVKENNFQRAFASTTTRTQQTATSQNRENLRRSVRAEAAPHPARLHKHRHGWTLHFAARNLDREYTTCTRSIVFLLIVILALLGLGATALYIVFEPEQLQVIQQYWRSSSRNFSWVENSTYRLYKSEETTTIATETSTVTTEASWNDTRYCDDCLPNEACVGLLNEDVPICREVVDSEDPTGCGGLCLINKQRCHRLDVDAFRCVEIEHYCLDDEWTCLNSLCIPLDKRCDGHMNCYDHSDEYNCVCDPATHFQCGNETSCLPLESQCDGRIDCWDATDEINCTLACPLDSEFTCSDGQCILKARFCDGLADCVDGSDEPHGCQGRCNKHEFTCQNSRCIVKSMRCNGIDDCGDNSDEHHCKDRSTRAIVVNLE